MSTIKIKAWLDSGANHDSTYWVWFEVDKDDWYRMSEEERQEYAKDHAWDRMDWGWFVEEESQDD
jgi:hypothetical protein